MRYTFNRSAAINMTNNNINMTNNEKILVKTWNNLYSPTLLVGV